MVGIRNVRDLHVLGIPLEAFTGAASDGAQVESFRDGTGVEEAGVVLLAAAARGDPCLEAAPGAFHKLFDEAKTIGAMRQRIRRYFKAFRFLGWGSASAQEEK